MADLLSIHAALKEHCSSRVQELGMELFREGAVSRHQHELNKSRARFRTGELATWSHKGGNYSQWSCTCETGSQGDVCEHLAALLFAEMEFHGPATARTRTARFNANSVVPHPLRQVVHDALNSSTSQELVQTEAKSACGLQARGPVDDFVWCGRGKLVSVGGYPLDSALVYVGAGRNKAGRGYVIDPAMGLAHAGSLSVWPGSVYPAYSTLSERGRSNYLEWLCSGRKKPEVHSQYIALFVAGLEARAAEVVRDLPLDAAVEATHELRDEVNRLIEVYAASVPELLRKHLLAFKDWLDLGPALLALERGEGAQHPHVKTSKSLELYALARAGLSVEGELALDMCLSLQPAATQGYMVRFPHLLRRCVIAEMAGEPISLTPVTGQTAVSLSYSPRLSGGNAVMWSSQTVVPLEVDFAPGAHTAVNDAIARATASLAAYARYRAVYPQLSDSLGAKLLLPMNAWAEREIQDWRQLVEEGVISGDWATICARVPHCEKVQFRPNLLESNQLLEFFAGQGCVLIGERGVLVGPVRKLTALDGRLALVLGLGAQASNAKELIDELEQHRKIVSFIVNLHNTFTNSAPQSSLSSWAEQATPRRAEQLLLRACVALDNERGRPVSKAAIKSLLAMAANDGSMQEMRTWLISGFAWVARTAKENARFDAAKLRAQFEGVGLTSREYFSMLHQLESGSFVDAPKGKGQRVIDEESLSRLARSTQATDELLSQIFKDESPLEELELQGTSEAAIETDEPASTSGTQEVTLWGLARGLSEIATRLKGRSSISVEEFNGMAASIQKLPGAAIELINDAAIDSTGMPLIEDDGPYTINQDCFE